MRGLLALVASLAMALSALGLALAAPGEPAAQAAARLTAATGAVHIVNSREGQAVLGAGAMRPGDTVAGTVRIGNDGTGTARLALRPGAAAEQPGPDGGRLSDALRLSVADVTDPARPVLLYAGPLTGFGELAAGTLARGAAREYRVLATFAPPPGDDNRFQGATLTLPLEWGATAVPAAATPTPTPTPAPRPPATPTPPTPVAPAPAVDAADALGLPAARTCVRGRTLRLRLRAPEGSRLRSATITVNGRAAARLKGARVHARVTLRRLPKGKVRLAVTAKAADGRTLRAARAYAAC